LPESEGATQYSQLLVFTPEKALNLRGIPIVYQDWPNYGKLAVLEVPKGTYVMGPEQADSLIDQDPLISSQFALWNRRGLDVIRGHTITIPLAEEVIYAEPIFLRSRQNRVTQLQKVAVVFRDRVAMGDSFEEALRSIYEQVESDADANANETVQPAAEVATPVAEVKTQVETIDQPANTAPQPASGYGQPVPGYAQPVPGYAPPVPGYGQLPGYGSTAR
jgi:uncharacterized membrane protein (UPF0182 family)